MKKSRIIGISLLVFLIFIVLSYFVARERLVQFDFDTTVKMQDNLPRSADAIFSFFSAIGSFEILTIVLILIIIFLRKLKAILILIPYTVLHLIEIYGKTFVDQSNPPFFFLRTESIIQFPSSYVQPGFSYPSGHSARTAFIAVLLAFIVYSSKKLSKNTKWVFYSAIIAFCLIMFASRVYLGEHWATDVVGGLLLGISSAIFSLLFI